MPDETSQKSGRGRSNSAVAQISQEMVGIYNHYYGRGPTRAKTVWHDDLVVTILEEVFTRAEQVLISGGGFQQVRLNRQTFQEEIEPEFRRVIEDVTGREVRSFLSQVNEDGLAAEIFSLHPAGHD